MLHEGIDVSGFLTGGTGCERGDPRLIRNTANRYLRFTFISRHTADGDFFHFSILFDDHSSFPL